MALLIPRVAITVGLALSVSGCSFVEPIVASEKYTVQDEGPGKAEIKVRIDGGAGVSRLRQHDVIQDFMLDMSRDPSRDSAAFDAMLELENLFELNGYPRVDVKYRIERDKGIRVVFTVVQNKQVILGSCKIVDGPESEEKLLRYLPRRQSKALGLGEGLYVAADIDTLRRGVITHCKALGYLDVEAEIEGPIPAIGPNVEKVSVRIKIDAKQRFFQGEIVIAEELRALLDDHAKQIASWKKRLERDPSSSEPAPGPDAPAPLKSGVPFITREIQNHVLAWTRYLRRWGHPEPEILTTITRDKDATGPNPTVSIRLHGTPGTKAIVVEIEVVKVKLEDGSTGFVAVSNIRDRISLEEGKRFDGDKEEESLRRLYRSGLFRGIETSYEQVGEGTIKVVFKVRDTTRYLVQPLIGGGSYERIRTGLQFEMLSIFDTDFDFNSNAVISDKGHRVVMSVADPEFWPELFGLDTTLTIAADDFRRQEPSYTDGATGLTPSISKLFNQQWSSRIGYTIRDHGSVFSSVIDPGAQIGNYREGSLIFEFAYDSRRNPVMPKQGTRVALQHKWADDSLGSEVSFHKTRLSASRVFPLTERTRFVVRAEAGIIVPESNMEEVPIQERFFNGGETTVRSFREDQLADPRLRDINGQVTGGGYRNVFNAELRWSPSWQPMNAVEMEFALFGDAGNLGFSSNDYRISDLEYAVGAGVRFLLPIGPVRFDYAHNPDRDPGERDWTFHFSIGHAF